MQLTAENIKKNYLILSVKLLIVAVFTFIVIIECYNIHHFLIFNSNLEGGIMNNLELISKTTYYRPTLIFTIPFIGVFINKKIGWILITSFFYYVLFLIVFKASIEQFPNKIDMISFAGFTMMILLLLAIMNVKKVRKLKYGISKSELIGKNIIASVIGISLTFVIVLISNV